MDFKDIMRRILETSYQIKIPSWKGVATMRENNRPLGKRDSPNHCRGPCHSGDGVLQPISARAYRLSLCATRSAGADEYTGRLYPSRRRGSETPGAPILSSPLSTRRAEEREDRQGAVSIPCGG